MQSEVCVINRKCYSYPDKNTLFRPSQRYPEYIFDEIESNNKNEIYDMVREAFCLLGFDKENYGHSGWNPLGYLVKPGYTVLIKPNMVMERNLIPQNGTECLYTNPSVVAAIIDYVCIALKGKGKIIIGDAPMQECKFDLLLDQSGYSMLINWYKKHGVNIDIVDFRELKSSIEHGIHVQSINENAKGKVIDLGDNSEFSVLKDGDYSKLRVTNYDPTILTQHHTSKKNEYYISDYVLNADVIINVPKPKSHRKAGATIAMKNLIGINVRKEFLPHHSIGSKSENGDEYLQKDKIHALRSKMLDKMNHNSFNGKIVKAQIERIIIKGLSMIKPPLDYKEGSWYGNNTISKTIIDLNKILIYADKHGVMRDEQQRKILIVADMIVSGEKEGPVAPTEKQVGTIAIGTNQVCFDEAIATLMGFDISLIPTMSNARNVVGKYSLCKDQYPLYISNSEKINGKSIDDIRYDDTYKFEPTSGWKGHIELKK